jgi:hypothetical protein
VRHIAVSTPQCLAAIRGPDSELPRAEHGAFGLTTDGLGLIPGNPHSFIQASDSPLEGPLLAEWFAGQWAALAAQPNV